MKRISFLAFTLLILLESIHAQERDIFLLFTDSVVTSDGLKLATDIYISNESETFPSLLILSLYDPLDPYPHIHGPKNIKALQTFYTGPKKPSSITLPVLNIVHD